MKTVKKLFVLALISASAVCNATSWRINSNPAAKAHFLTINDAMAGINVYPGDTLLMDPGAHADGSVNKLVTIIGPGYMIGQNNNTWSESQTATFNNLTICKDCKVYGIVVSNSLSVSENCTVERCMVGTVDQHTGQKNVIIKNCFLNKTSMHLGENNIFTNNICINNNGSGYIGGDYYGAGNYGANSLVANNIIYIQGTDFLVQGLKNCTIKDNIIINTKEGYTTVDGKNKPYSNFCINMDPTNNNAINNNVLSTTAAFADKVYTNNKFIGAKAEDVFVWSGNSEDGKFKLKENSPAAGYSSNGGDCGAFGGATPYILSGFPRFFPHITEAIIPGTSTNNTLKISLKIENQNE